MMNRYYYYPFILCMLVNTIFYVPVTLAEYRFQGAWLAILFAIVFGSTLAYLFTKTMRQFPGQGLPEIFEQRLPVMLSSVISFSLGLLWIVAGGLVLIAFSYIAKMFLNPSIPIEQLLFCLIIVSCYAATRSTAAINYLSEIILIFILPIVVFILFKALQSETFEWNAIMVTTEYIFEIPSWNTLSTAMFCFTGYMTLIVLNRFFTWRISLTHFWLVPVTGAITLVSSFLIPIGIHGTQAVENYLYLWVNTVDSLRMEFGFIERVVFYYLMVYVAVSLLFISMSWHIGTELVGSIFRGQSKRYRWIIVGVVGIATWWYGRLTNQKQLIMVAEQWFMVRFMMELLLVLLMVLIGRRKR
ncbi:GerAB/ArcD/ProY family transporter [Brevibacillus porteri]|uniref:GerAB/ArcD/ProY family transporter n=1 Tax=Brevibacillus porteri TaxID=2126350 RepID=UPI003D2545F7